MKSTLVEANVKIEGILTEFADLDCAKSQEETGDRLSVKPAHSAPSLLPLVKLHKQHRHLRNSSSYNSVAFFKLTPPSIFSIFGFVLRILMYMYVHSANLPG